jgi:hypothetical protein
MNRKQVIAAVKKILSSNDDFKKRVVVFFQMYVDELDELANDTFEVASSVLDFEGKKLLRDANKLLDDFQSYHDTKKVTYQALLEEFNLITLAQKKIITEETLKVFEYDIKQLLKIYNVRAQVKVEDILLTEIEKLSNLTFDEIKYFWVNLPDEYILTY